MSHMYKFGQRDESETRERRKFYMQREREKEKRKLYDVGEERLSGEPSGADDPNGPGGRFPTRPWSGKTDEREGRYGQSKLVGSRGRLVGFDGNHASPMRPHGSGLAKTG